MKHLLWLLSCVVILAGCSTDNTAKEPFPPERIVEFKPQLVEALQIDQVQKLYSSSNKLVFYFVTTYEQAAYLKRNSAYLSLRTSPEAFSFPKMKLTLLDRFEVENEIYYGMKLQLDGSGKEWLDIPAQFTTVEVLFEQQPLFQMDVGTVIFGEMGKAHVDYFSMDQLQPLVQLLHERQK